MRAEELVELVERRGLVGLQDALGISRGRAEALDVEARRMVRSGFGESEVGRSLTASAIARQQAIRALEAREVTPETSRILAALDRLGRPPTPDEIASRLDADRRRYVEAKNAVDEPARQAYAAQLRRSGYAGFTGGQR
jgi:hypothetical protein